MASDAGVPQEFLHSCYSTQRIPHWTPEKGVCSTNPFEGGAAEREKTGVDGSGKHSDQSPDGGRPSITPKGIPALLEGHGDQQLVQSVLHALSNLIYSSY